MKFLTEAELRTRFGLGQGSEIRLGADERLTPSAAEFVRTRNIRVITVTDDGAVAVVDKDGGEKRVNPLRIETETPGRTCVMCGQNVVKKPEGMTHLDATTLVPKTHPRIVLRGKIDAAIAATVVVQTQFDCKGKLPATLKLWLGDLRSWLGRIMRSEVTGEHLPELAMGEFTLEVIHAISHNPKKYVGHEHIVADETHGRNVALLNWLRAQVRELELAAVQTFETPEMTLTRSDIVEALNRLSSAIYVLMLLTLAAEQGKDISKVGAI